MMKMNKLKNWVISFKLVLALFFDLKLIAHVRIRSFSYLHVQVLVKK